MATRRSHGYGTAATRWPALAACAAVLLLVGLGTGGCDIEKPEVPTFSTRLSIPIGQERIEMLDVLEDQDYIVIDDGGLISFHIDGEPDTVALDLDLRAEIEAADVDILVGTYNLDVADSASFAFTLGELYPDAIFLNGLTIPVPGFSFDIPSNSEAFTGLVYADISTGQLSVTLTNNLPIPISGTGPPEQINATLMDPSTSSTIAVVVFANEIAPGSQATATSDLAGQTLPGDVAIQLTGGSPGSATPVTIYAADNLLLDAKLINLSVSESLARIGPQSFNTDYEVSLPDTIQVVEAEILSGDMDFDLYNGLPIPCEVQLHWNEILDTGDQPLVTTYWLPALSSQQQNLNLAGMRISSLDGTPMQELGISALVTSPGSSGLPVLLLADDVIQASSSATEVTLGEVTGSIPEQTFTFDPFSEDIDLPEEMDTISLTAASLLLRVDNGTGMPASISSLVTGTAEDSSKATMSLVADIAPADNGGRRETVIVLDETNSNIVDFLNHKPVNISFEGEVVVGGETVLGTVRPQDFSVLSWEIIAPAEVILAETVFGADPDDLDLDEDTKELIRDHALSAQVAAEVVNHFPVSVDLTIYVSDDTTTITTAPLLTVTLENVAAGQLDPILHTVSSPTVSYPELSLTTEQIQVFGVPERLLFTVLEVTLPGSDGPVRFHETDYLEVQGLVNLEVLVTE